MYLVMLDLEGQLARERRVQRCAQRPHHGRGARVRPPSSGR
jgi:hypothetical protein